MKCRNFCLGLMMALCLTGVAASPALASAPQPEVVANHIVDSTTGDEFIPRGVNFPSFEYACERGFGYANTGAVDAAHDAITADAMKSWKINTVRIPLNQDCWLGEDGLPSTDPIHHSLGFNYTSTGYRAAVAQFVDALNAQGIVAILDLHWSGPDGVKADGLRAMADNRSDDFWSSVATTFESDPSVMFDLFNEPHSQYDNSVSAYIFNLTWDIWKNGGGDAPVENDLATTFSGNTFKTVGMNDLVSTVRATGAKQPIILGGLDYANDLTGWLAHRPDDDQLIAGFHNYEGQRCSNITCWQSEISPVAAVVPVLTGEIGQPVCGAVDVSHTHLGRYLDWANTQHIGYLAWAWWTSTDPCASNYDLISNYDGTPKSPVGTYFRADLILAAASKSEPDPSTPTPTPNPGRPTRGQTKARKTAKLRISAPHINGGRIHFKVHAVAAATGKVKVVLYSANAAGRRVHRSAAGRLKSGSATFTFKLGSEMTPKKITARYAGNKKVKPDRAHRLIGS